MGGPLSQLSTLSLSFNLVYHVIAHVSVLVLRAEHDDLRVGIDLYIMPRRPVKKFTRVHTLLNSIGIGGTHGPRLHCASSGNMHK